MILVSVPYRGSISFYPIKEVMEDEDSNVSVPYRGSISFYTETNIICDGFICCFRPLSGFYKFLCVLI